MANGTNVTFTLSGSPPYWLNTNSFFVVTGLSPSGYNSGYVAKTIGTNTITADTAASYGAITVGTGTASFYADKLAEVPFQFGNGEFAVSGLRFEHAVVPAGPIIQTIAETLSFSGLAFEDITVLGTGYGIEADAGHVAVNGHNMINSGIVPGATFSLYYTAGSQTSIQVSGGFHARDVATSGATFNLGLTGSGYPPVANSLNTLGTLRANATPTIGLGSAVVLSGANGSAAALRFMDATSSVQTQIDTKSPKASPAFTGTLNLGSFTSKTNTFTVDDSSTFYGCDTPVGPYTVTLPTTTGRTMRLYVLYNYGSTNITITPQSGQYLDGRTSVQLPTGTCFVIVTDGYNWRSTSQVFARNSADYGLVPYWSATTGNLVTTGSPTGTELGYLSGVTSAIQTQINARATTANLNPSVTTLADGATITWTVSSSQAKQMAKVTLGGARTLAFSGLSAGMDGYLWVIQDGTGSRTLTLPSGSKVANGGSGAVTLTTTAGAIDLLTWVYDGTNLYWTVSKNFN